MAVAYILEQNATVAREGQRLVIKKDRKVLHTLHIFKLDQIVIFGRVFLSPSAIAFLLGQGVDTVFMTWHGRYQGRLQPPQSKNITLRQEQFDKMGKDDFCLKTAQAIVGGKIANLRATLLRLNRSHKGLILENQILGLKQLMRKIPETTSLDTIRGLEGRSAVLYFEGFGKGILAEGVQFNKRVRRPPTDPVNALLSLGYTLLFNSFMAAVSMVGFDPYLGCLHAPEYGRPSLALDLMEEWRPIIVDSLVLSLFNLKTLTLEDFTVEEQTVNNVEKDTQDLEEDESDPKLPRSPPVKLTDKGFRKFISQFERKMNQKVQFHLTGSQYSYRDCIREQVRHFARYVRGDEELYQPMRWR